MSTQLRPGRIRFLQRKDLPQVLDIEYSSFDYPWSRQDFEEGCNTETVCASVVVNPHNDDQVYAYFLYEQFARRINLLNLAVAKEFQRQGVGSRILTRLKEKLGPKAITRINFEIRETNLPAQLFLKSQGFRAVNVLRRWYTDVDEDCFLFQYRYKAQK